MKNFLLDMSKQHIAVWFFFASSLVAHDLWWMSFIAYVSIKNSFNLEVKDIIIKAEIQMERQRILLLDT